MFFFGVVSHIQFQQDMTFPGIWYCDFKISPEDLVHFAQINVAELHTFCCHCWWFRNPAARVIYIYILYIHVYESYGTENPCDILQYQLVCPLSFVNSSLMERWCCGFWVDSIGRQERDGFFLVGRNKNFQWQDLEQKKAPGKQRDGVPPRKTNPWRLWHS